MSPTDLAVGVGAGVVGFGIIWGLFNLVRQQRAPPLEMFKAESRAPDAGRSRLSVADLGRQWQRILGVSAQATLAEIEAGYQARLADCERIRFSPTASASEKQAAESRRADVTEAYEFIRHTKDCTP
jgi:hypothetical protein